MSAPPPTSPWPAPTLAAGGPRLPSSTAIGSTVATTSSGPARKPVGAAVDAARRLLNPTLRAEHQALREEQRISADLRSLPLGWSVLPVAEVEVLDGDLGIADHFVIGPAGVFIVRVEHHPAARVWVSERAMTINGASSDGLVAARFEARKVGGRLTDRCGFAVTVQSVLVMIGATVQTVSRPAEVHVRGHHDLRDWLCLQPKRLDPGEASAISRLVELTRKAAAQAVGSSTTTGI